MTEKDEDIDLVLDGCCDPQYRCLFQWDIAASGHQFFVGVLEK